MTELLADLKNKSNGEQQKVQEEEPKAGSSGIVRDDYRQREEIKDLFGKNVELKKEMGKLSEDVKQRQTNQEKSLSAINSRQARSECHADSTDKALEALKEKVDNEEAVVAFGLFPVSIKQLKAVADAGDIMPPKSTWIEPKMRSGLTIYDLKD